MTPDAERKRDLLHAWLTQHAAFRLPFHPGGPLNGPATLASLRAQLPVVSESVYVLVRRSAPLVPLYIGRAANPGRRWQGHFRDYRKGVKKDVRWSGYFADSLDLFVVPVSEMLSPPIPCFPVTAGAVESQLISLAQDAYPGLSNREGVGR